MISKEKINEFNSLFVDFKKLKVYNDRQNQKLIAPLFKDIIWETLKNEIIKNEYLTGLIQMFGWRCKADNFRKYMELCVKDENRCKELIAKSLNTEQRGFTNIGKTAITDLSPADLKNIRLFLLNSFEIKSVEQAETLCRDFENLNIPQVKQGIYSPWLYYIEPAIFPMVNNSHANFKKWFGVSKNYTDSIREYHQFKEAVNEPDFAGIDYFAHLLTDEGELNYRRYLQLKGKSIYKISHGVFAKNFKDSGVREIMEEKRWICMHEDTGKNQGHVFAEELSIGDFIYLCYGGDEVGLIGEIISDVKPLPDVMKQAINRPGEPWIYREVKELFQPNNQLLNAEMKQLRYAYMPSGNWTFAPIPNDNLNWVNQKLFIPYYNVEVVGDEEPNEEELDTPPNKLKENNIMNPQNIILYGPPGTGKTYASMTHAVAIIEGTEFETIDTEDRKEVRNRFDNYVAEKQIVFTTFHQSLGYEDFIEGIKPVPPGDGAENLQYEVNDGIFKTLSINAAFTIAQELEKPGEGYLNSFDLLYDAYIAAISERLDKDEKVTLDSKNGNILMIESISEYGNVLVKHSEETRTYTVSKNRLLKLDAAFPELDEVNNIYNAFRGVIGGSNASAYWAVLNAIREQAPLKMEVPLDAFDYKAKKSVVQSIPIKDFGKAKGKPFVLIIDEINRGNIAQIFGELITLIEKDKRMGMDEGLRASLPYSGKEFGVPHNVHIIGTMNTADRSVEALDTALRRRFSFKHLKPDASKLEPTVDGIDLPAMLNVINKRLTILKDSDHTIGHAWFMDNHAAKDVTWLKGIFKDKILPLLQEYFYGDYEKIGLVLGEQFFEEMSRPDAKVFAWFKKGNNQANQYNQVWQYKLKPTDTITEIDFKTIYEGVANNQTGTDEDE